MEKKEIRVTINIEFSKWMYVIYYMIGIGTVFGSIHNLPSGYSTLTYLMTDIIIALFWPVLWVSQLATRFLK